MHGRVLTEQESEPHAITFRTKALAAAAVTTDVWMAASCVRERNLYWSTSVYHLRPDRVSGLGAASNPPRPAGNACDAFRSLAGAPCAIACPRTRLRRRPEPAPDRSGVPRDPLSGH